jgi:transposase InsO family protein
VILAYIDEHARLGVETICRVLTDHGIQIAPSTYYARRASPVTDAELADAYAANALVGVWRGERGLYGIRKLWHALRREHPEYAGIGRDQVGRLMRLAGLSGVVRGRSRRTVTTDADRTAPRAADLVNRAWNTPAAPDQWWVGDFTYVWTLAGFVYVAFLTDVYSRRILGWRVSATKATPLVTSCLEQALFTRRREYADTRVEFTSTGILHHSDAGSQYTSLAFTDALRDAGIAASIGSVGDALDNALMESAIGLFKTELTDRHPRSWTGLREVETETATWVHWYNTRRLHSALAYTPPVEYEDAYHRTSSNPTAGDLPAVA